MKDKEFNEEDDKRFNEEDEDLEDENNELIRKMRIGLNEKDKDKENKDKGLTMMRRMRAPMPVMIGVRSLARSLTQRMRRTIWRTTRSLKRR